MEGSSMPHHQGVSNNAPQIGHCVLRLVVVWCWGSLASVKDRPLKRSGQDRDRHAMIGNCFLLPSTSGSLPGTFRKLASCADIDGHRTERRSIIIWEHSWKPAPSGQSPTLKWCSVRQAARPPSDCALLRSPVLRKGSPPLLLLSMQLGKLPCKILTLAPGHNAVPP